MIGTATTVAGMGMALYISLEAYSQGGRFAWHPFCMSLGALGLSTAGIQAVRSRRTAEGLQAKTRRTQVLSTIAYCCSLHGPNTVSFCAHITTTSSWRWDTQEQSSRTSWSKSCISRSLCTSYVTGRLLYDRAFLSRVLNFECQTQQQLQQIPPPAAKQQQ